MHRRSRRNPTPPVGKDRSILIGIGVGLGVVTLGGAWLWYQNRKSLDTLRLVGTLADTITPRVLALLPNPPPGGLRDLALSSDAANVRSDRRRHHQSLGT